MTNEPSSGAARQPVHLRPKGQGQPQLRLLRRRHHRGGAGRLQLPRQRLPDGDSKIFTLYAFGPLGFWSMAPLRYAAKFDPFLSLDCDPMPSTPAQSKERKGSNFAIWQPCDPVKVSAHWHNGTTFMVKFEEHVISRDRMID